MALEFGAGEPVQQYVRYPVDFVVEGSFPAQTQFLSLVERVPRLALVERLKVEPMATAGQVTATYTLYLYVDERRPATAADLEDLVFRRQPGRPNPFLPPAR
jgi:Tfp pilus assembly protein PilO